MKYIDFVITSNISLNVNRINCIFYHLGCPNELPSDYWESCPWTCKDWASMGYCDDDWSELRYCVSETTGLVKEFCKESCGVCGGKYIMSLILRFTKIINFMSLKDC